MVQVLPDLVIPARKRDDHVMQVCPSHNEFYSAILKISSLQEAMAKDIEAVRELLSRTIVLEEHFLNLSEDFTEYKKNHGELERRVDLLEQKQFAHEKLDERARIIIALVISLIGASFALFQGKFF